MAKTARTFTILFVISGLCLTVGSFLAVTEVSDDPLSRSSMLFIVGAVFIATGVAALFSESSRTDIFVRWSYTLEYATRSMSESGSRKEGRHAQIPKPSRIG